MRIRRNRRRTAPACGGRRLRLETLERRDAPGVLLGALPAGLAWASLGDAAQGAPARIAGAAPLDSALSAAALSSAAPAPHVAFAVPPLGDREARAATPAPQRPAIEPQAAPLAPRPAAGALGSVWSLGGAAPAPGAPPALSPNRVPHLPAAPASPGGSAAAGGSSSVEPTATASGSARSAGAAPPASFPATSNASPAAAAPAPLPLLDLAGAPLAVAPDAGTLIVGAATWCSATHSFVAALAQPETAAQLAGLRIVLAFGDEGGAGPGGVQYADFLENLPAEAALLAPGAPRPSSFPSVFSASTGQFDQNAFAAVQSWWLANTPEGAATAAEIAAQPSPAPLALLDAQGAALAVDFDDPNTLIVAAATWCGATKNFVAALQQPEAAAQLEGLRIVLAFSDEGGSGPGGVLHPDFLDNLPAEVAFLAPGSVRPDRFPTAFNPASGRFDATAVEAVNAWVAGDLLSGGACGNKNPVPAEAALVAAAKLPSTGEPERDAADPVEALPDKPAAAVCALPGDYDANGVVDGADLLVWQRQAGSFVDEGTGADGTGDGRVDGEDLALWQAHFGETCGLYDYAITAPAGAVATATPTVQWTESLGAFSYDVHIATDAACANIVESHLGVAALSQITGPLANGTYYACVFADNPSASPELWAAKNNGLQFVVDAAPVQMEHVVFITSTSHPIASGCEANPDGECFGGHNSADYICTVRAAVAGLLPGWNGDDLVYKALISTATLSAKNHANIQARVVNNYFPRVVLANNAAEFWDGNLDAGITHDEFGNEVPTSPNPTNFWSGSNQFGDSSTSCSNWTSTAGQGRAGSSHTTTNWFNQFGLTCIGARRLLCMSPAQPQQ